MTEIFFVYTGEFAQVYRGYMTTLQSTDVVAVKTLKGTLLRRQSFLLITFLWCHLALGSANDMKQLTKEIVKMVTFDHPNVMRLIGVTLVEGGAPLLVMPYMMKGTLLSFVRDNKAQFLMEDCNNSNQV